MRTSVEIESGLKEHMTFTELGRETGKGQDYHHKGPALIRNYFIEQDTGLSLFACFFSVDTDTSPVGEDFFSLYLKNVGGQVVCGGFCYPEEGSSFLRNKYGAPTFLRYKERKSSPTGLVSVSRKSK